MFNFSREVNEIFAKDLESTLEEYQENQPENFPQDFKQILLAIALPYDVRLVFICFMLLDEGILNLFYILVYVIYFHG